jgi:hypothetical protein
MNDPGAATPIANRIYAWAVFIFLAIAMFAMIAFLPRSREVKAASESPDGFNIASVTVLRTGVARAINLAAMGCFVALVVINVRSRRRRAHTQARVAAVAVLLGAVAPIISFLRDPAPWQIFDEARAEDGTNYCFAESHFLQGQTLILARVKEEAMFTRTVEVIVVTNGDSPRSYLLLVRPASAADGYGQVHLTESGWVLGLRSANQCYFAFDRRTGRRYGHGAVERLSPFLALGGADEPLESDVSTVKSALTEGTQGEGAPSEEAISDGLDHSNPRVREVAAQLLDAMRR